MKSFTLNSNIRIVKKPVGDIGYLFEIPAFKQIQLDNSVLCKIPAFPSFKKKQLDNVINKYQTINTSVSQR